MQKRKVDFIKMAATARHIHETVFSRISERNGTLTADETVAVMQTAITLARLAHVGDE